MTGVNPGKHGNLRLHGSFGDDYGWKFPNFNDLQSRTLWDIAGDSQKRSVVLNIPSTYPARPLNGYWLPIVALDLRRVPIRIRSIDISTA